MVRFDEPEGATPIDDASGLLVEGVFTKAALNAVEAENILSAINEHLRPRKRREKVWFTEQYIREVHRDMFDQVWKWAGQYRDSELNIGVQHFRIRNEVAQLCQDVAFWDEQKENPISALERAVRIHHRLSWIHPFTNGNGRHARMMADIYLFVNGQKFPTWPSAAIGGAGELRTAYLQALKKADGGDFGPLTEYTARFLPASA